MPRLVDASAWRNRSKTYGRNSGSMPAPVSRHGQIGAATPLRATVTSTRRRVGVNFTAFDSRFQTTCCSAIGVADEQRLGVGRELDLDRDLLRRRRPAHDVDRAASTIATRSDRPRSRRSLPVTMRETSSMSSIEPRLRARVAVDRRRSPRAARVRRHRRRRIAVQPRMALSGVRSSCESVARNSSLARFASCDATASRTPSAAARAACSRSSARSISSACLRAVSRGSPWRSRAARRARRAGA